MKIRKLAACFLVLTLTGCAPTFTSMRVALNPGGELEVITAEPDWRSIVVVGVVRDEGGKIFGVVSGQGATKAQIALDIAQIASVIAMPLILGPYLIKAAGNIEQPWASRVEFPDND